MLYLSILLLFPLLLSCLCLGFLLEIPLNDLDCDGAALLTS